ncbi:hypothetical protein IMG5_167370 [Ichthyophthirius multifiliis]|uniref:HNH domain-containing protein n=1 Tax=Ichthyophthirius multifiliis TaxID=5932 RepID=G0R0X2_ICHMU|nr:hypothetical protein IMG5_167370 [Ichthyophthirius multifiliis]EGR28883.1 hypothetical protein IMG5_167370 [Ichthyophthirius multifiliis]|eukprot:XP_004030119.1 hypothetical protein IMG5_167370 [Ichthyophthirius multifiliis]
MIGRHPERWRLDAVGNPVIKSLTSCNGPLCYQYDHIVPYSKGGETQIENCQLLQSIVNKHKSNKIDATYSELKNVSPKDDFTNFEYDCIEKAIYGTYQSTTYLKTFYQGILVEIQSSKYLI